VEAGLLRDLLTLLLGLVTGVLSALFGVGGAILSNPGLRALGAAPLVAVGTTLPSILPGAVSGTLRYHRERLIDWRIVKPAAAAGLLAVVGGSLLSHVVPGEGHLLLLLIAVLLAFTAWRTAFTGPADTPSSADTAGPRPGPQPIGAGDSREHPTPPSATLPLRGASRREVRSSRADPVGGAAADGGVGGVGGLSRSRWMAAGIGLLSGLLSGLLGIGGGVIMVPAFIELLGMSLKPAIATSLVCVGIFGVPATITHALLGDIDWRLAALLTVAVVPGARLGASLTIRTAERRLRLAVGVFLALVSLVYFVTETRALLAL
jgi:uncharacterized membrane protein YfcA